jgi:undecaprenyl-diphosphatase
MDGTAGAAHVSSRRWRPPTIPIPAGVDRFDAVIDDWFEAHLRGRPAVDRVMYTASAVGDHGLIWLALGLLQASRRRPGWPRTLLRTGAGLGLESLLVNGPVKWIFLRTRPVDHGLRPLALRQPRTSSFPSGHATAAFFGAALLRDDDPLWPLYYAVAIVVAASRVHVRIHHASDVIGGIVLGVALGELTRHLVPVGTRDRATGPSPDSGQESPPPGRG